MTKKKMYKTAMDRILTLIITIPQSTSLEMAHGFYSQALGAIHLAHSLELISGLDETDLYEKALTSYVNFKCKEVYGINVEGL